MGFFKQEYWSGLPFPSPDVPDPGIEPASRVSPALLDSSLAEPSGKPVCIHTHTHTHTYIKVYIYIYKEYNSDGRDEEGKVWEMGIELPCFPS